MIKKLIRALWVAQPRWLRRAELAVMETITHNPLDSARTVSSGDVVVCGFLGTASGLGQTARQVVRELGMAGYAVKDSNFSRYAVLDHFNAGPLWPEKATEGGSLVVCVNPDIFHLVYRALGKKRIEKRRVIGLWFWELETFPKNWVRALDLVDEVWAGSDFIARNLRKIAGDKPVHTVITPLDVPSIPTMPVTDPFPQFSGKKIVFFMYDVRSVHARKNPEGVIRAFREAAERDSDAVLLIKINNASAWPRTLEMVKEAMGDAPNIHILQERYSDAVMRDIMARADVVISLHRSEGFGLLMAEAMAAGKPVIATGWSANTDFMDDNCSMLVNYTLVPVQDPQNIYDRFDAVWAEPDIHHAARCLRELLDNPEKRHTLGHAAREKMLAYFAPERWQNSLSPTFKAVAGRNK